MAVNLNNGIENRENILPFVICPTQSAVFSNFHSNFLGLPWLVKVLLILAVVGAGIGLVLSVMQLLLQPDQFFSYVMFAVAFGAFAKTLQDIFDKALTKEIRAANSRYPS